MDGMVSILKALVGGYVAAIALQAALALLITREGRGVLMDGDRMSNAFHVQNGLAWFFSSALAAAVALHFVAATPIGPVIAGGIALLLILVVLRNHLKAPRQQSIVVNLLFLLCIACGSAASCLMLLKRA